MVVYIIIILQQQQVSGFIQDKRLFKLVNIFLQDRGMYENKQNFDISIYRVWKCDSDFSCVILELLYDFNDIQKTIRKCIYEEFL